MLAKNPNGYEEPFAFVMLKEIVEAISVIDEIKKVCDEKLEQEQVPISIKVINGLLFIPSEKRDMEQLIQIASEL